jgi:tetratricopeptide (TPR) repeat protein
MLKLVAALLCVVGFAGRAAAAMGSPWVEVDSPHFAVVTDSNEKEARKLAGQFERMRSLFKEVLPFAAGDAGLPITVLALKDRKGFVALEPAAYLSKGSLPLDGLFLRTPDRNYILLRLDTEHEEHPFAVVYHEYTHFVLRKAEWLPIWLNEGLAQFYENTDIGETSVSLGQPTADLILFLRDQRLLPLPTLFAVGYDSPYYHQEDKGSVFYAESWALTHMIEVQDAQRKQHRLQDYAHYMVKGEDAVTAAQHAFGDLTMLQKQLNDYVSSGTFSFFTLKKSFAVDAAAFPSRVLPVDQANAFRADVLANDDRRPEAEALLRTVLAADPQNVLAHETMGSLAFRDRDLANAVKWYGAAIALDSKSYFAEYSFAVCSLMAGDTGKNGEIEEDLRKAIAMEPDFAPAYDALEHLLVVEHKDLNEAHMLGLKAIQLEPEDLDFRRNIAETLMIDGKPEAALSVLQAADKEVAKTDAEHAELQGRMTQIRSYEAAEAAHEAAVEPRRAVTEAARGSDVTATAGATRQAGMLDDGPLPAPLPEASGSTPNREATGLLGEVTCSYPKTLTLALDKPSGRLLLFTPDMYSLSVRTAFALKGAFDPCTMLSGSTATVKYVEVQGSAYGGKIIAIQLIHAGAASRKGK